RAGADERVAPRQRVGERFFNRMRDHFIRKDDISDEFPSSDLIREDELSAAWCRTGEPQCRDEHRLEPWPVWRHPGLAGVEEGRRSPYGETRTHRIKEVPHGSIREPPVASTAHGQLPLLRLRSPSGADLPGHGPRRAGGTGPGRELARKRHPLRATQGDG